jgi:hypothetical protein
MLRRAAPLLLLGLAACGGSNASGDAATGDGPHAFADAFVPQDAPPGPFGCLGKPVPKTAPDPVKLTGKAQTVSGTSIVPADHVAIAALRPNGTTITTATTDVNGAYSLTLPTGGVALDMYVKATLSGDRDTTLYPATALYGNSDGGVILIITPGTFDLITQLAGVNQSASKGAIGIAVVDCDGTPLANATVSTTPAGTVRYAEGNLPSASATATDATGVAFIFNVPAGNVTVAASVGGMALRSHAVNAPAGVTTTTAIRP